MACMCATLGAGAVLMNPDNRAVDAGVFQVGFIRDGAEDLLKDALHAPAPEDRIPATELVIEIAPGCPGAGNPKNRLQEPSILGSMAARVTGLTWQQRRHTLPLRVAQQASIQC